VRSFQIKAHSLDGEVKLVKSLKYFVDYPGTLGSRAGGGAFSVSKHGWPKGGGTLRSHYLKHELNRPGRSTEDYRQVSLWTSRAHATVNEYQEDQAGITHLVLPNTLDLRAHGVSRTAHHQPDKRYQVVKHEDLPFLVYTT